VSAGTPGSSSPELATSSAGSVAGAPVAGALGAAVGDVGAASACGSPSVVTTASPSGAATETEVDLFDRRLDRPEHGPGAGVDREDDERPRHGQEGS
jgi:hypothetical protein